MMSQAPDGPADMSTLDARRDNTDISLDDDGSSYTCVRFFGAAPDRVFRAFTHPDDLQVWFPSAAPDGSEMTRCESDATPGGAYRYEMHVPGFGPMAWFGEYTRVDRPDRIEAEEWFVMGEGEPEGPPTTQSLTFDEVDDGLTRMTMQVQLPAPEDPEAFEQSAAGLSSSLSTLDELVSS